MLRTVNDLKTDFGVRRGERRLFSSSCSFTLRSSYRFQCYFYENVMFLHRPTSRRTTGTLWSAATLSARICRTLGRRNTILSSTAALPRDRSRTTAARTRPRGWLRDSRSARLSGRKRLRKQSEINNVKH